MAKKKDKRTNSQKHKENVSKDLRKKRIAKQKENAKRYAYNGGGSRVIERSKTDVGRAPAMRGEPIKSKGFVNTFPYMTGSGQGFFTHTHTHTHTHTQGSCGLRGKAPCSPRSPTQEQFLLT